MIKKILISILFLLLFNFLYSDNNFKIIKFSSDFNLKQTYNDCGPYNCFALLKALGKDVNLNEIKKYMNWRLKNNYTLPWGIEETIKRFNIKIKKYNFSVMNDDIKIEYIKKEISIGNPIIILGGINQYQHYITIFGYTNDTFFIYDSLLKKDINKNGNFTIDENNDLPGNKNLTKTELLNFWKNGGKFLFFNWYALIVENQ